MKLTEEEKELILKTRFEKYEKIELPDFFLKELKEKLCKNWGYEWETVSNEKPKNGFLLECTEKFGLFNTYIFKPEFEKLYDEKGDTKYIGLRDIYKLYHPEKNEEEEEEE